MNEMEPLRRMASSRSVGIESVASANEILSAVADPALPCLGGSLPMVHRSMATCKVQKLRI
jgi:hypothetical protein